MPNVHEKAQVVVWGGGSGGVAAALQAARGGADTLLMTPGPWLGGMVSAAGVCCPDGNELTPWQTGLWGAFLRQLALEEPEGLDHNWVSCFGYRPATAEAILRRWCAATPRLRWWDGVELLAVGRRGDRIDHLQVQRHGQSYRVELQLIIDGSDRGDLFPLARVPFRLGWESQELWGEPSAPPQQRLDREPFFQQQPVQSPTWVVMGQLVERGNSDPGRLGLTAEPQPALAEPFAGACQSFGLERTLTYGRLPGGLVMLNWPLQGNDWHRDLGRGFDPDPAVQAELFAEMQAHSLAFSRALEEVSEGLLQQGQCFPAPGSTADNREGIASLQGTGAVALMPYWREGRRLVGESIVLEQQLLPQASGASIAALPMDAQGRISSIAVGNYANDHHYPGGDWPLAPKSTRWGGRWSGTPFAIPYGALLSGEVRNLLAADKGISTSHMANGATRLQPLILNIGQAAGAAAALCVERHLDPGQLPVRLLQDTLLADLHAPAGPVPLWDTPWHHPEWAERQRAALDDPGRLNTAGGLAGSPLSGLQSSAPDEPGERLWEGQLFPDGDGGYQLEVKGRRWPLITLEPGLHHWLQQQDRPCRMQVVGCLNPWGPWLRVSRLAE